MHGESQVFAQGIVSQLFNGKLATFKFAFIQSEIIQREGRAEKREIRTVIKRILIVCVRERRKKARESKTETGKKA